MTLSLVQHAHGVTNNGATSWTVTLPTGAASGNLLVCATISDTVTRSVAVCTAATDDQSGTWTNQLDVVFDCDMRIDAKVSTGNERVMTCHSTHNSGGVGIVMEMHSSSGPLSLGSIYLTNSEANDFSTTSFFQGVPVAAAMNADWIIGFVAVDNVAYTFTSWSPWITTEPTVASVGTGNNVTGANATKTGGTGSGFPQWTVSSAPTGLSSAVIAITDNTVTPPVPTSTWW